MIEISPDDRWSANAAYINWDIFKGDDIKVRQEVASRVTAILNKRSPQTSNAGWNPTNHLGISVIGEQGNNPQIYMATITKVRSTKKNALFYISTDDQDFIDYLVTNTKVTKGGRTCCPIIPTYTGEEFSDEEKCIIDLFCIKEMSYIYSNPFNAYAFNIASTKRTAVGIPHEEGIFISSKHELLNM